jgi:hypothetical protein
MLEVLTHVVPAEPGESRRMHRPATHPARAGDLRDLQRFGRLGVTSAPLEDGKQSDHRPPGYRRQKGKLFEAAVAAYRRRKQAGALTSRALA